MSGGADGAATAGVEGIGSSQKGPAPDDGGQPQSQAPTRDEGPQPHPPAQEAAQAVSAAAAATEAVQHAPPTLPPPQQEPSQPAPASFTSRAAAGVLSAFRGRGPAASAPKQPAASALKKSGPVASAGLGHALAPLPPAYLAVALDVLQSLLAAPRDAAALLRSIYRVRDCSTEPVRRFCLPFCSK